MTSATSPRRSRRRTATLAAGVGLVVVGCGEAASPAADDPAGPGPGGSAPAVVFRDAASSSGLDFQHVSGARGDFAMPEIMGGGVALIDADRDGLLDVYCVQSGNLGDASGPGNQLFHNLGDLRFADASASSGADHRGYGNGAAVGDADGDGHDDLYVTNVGPNALLLSRGALRFEDATAASGTGHPGWGTSAAFADTDADGDLDLFVVNYLDWSPAGELTCHNEQGLRDYCSPQAYESPARDVLYRNEGGARFRDVSAASGIASVPGAGLGIGCGDFDLDGRLDVFVANDGMADALWHNQGDGRFEDIALLAGCAVDDSGRPKAGMGVALGDVDDDGDLDLAVCNLAGQSDSFYLNEGGWFRDQTATSGLAAASKSRTRFGFGLIDVDNDGVLDLYQANGRVAVGTEHRGDDPYAEPDLLLLGERRSDGGLVLRPAASADGTAESPALTSRAAAFGDLDNDGRVDVVVIHRDGPARLLHNVTAPSPWIGLAVRERDGRHALGASVRVQLDGGERTLTRDVRAASSYQASNDPRVHVGLGADARVHDVRVTWADGAVESFGALEPGRWHDLRRGAD